MKSKCKQILINKWIFNSCIFKIYERVYPGGLPWVPPDFLLERTNIFSKRAPSPLCPLISGHNGWTRVRLPSLYVATLRLDNKKVKTQNTLRMLEQENIIFCTRNSSHRSAIGHLAFLEDLSAQQSNNSTEITPSWIRWKNSCRQKNPQ